MESKICCLCFIYMQRNFSDCIYFLSLSLLLSLPLPPSLPPPICVWVSANSLYKFWLTSWLVYSFYSFSLMFLFVSPTNSNTSHLIHLTCSVHVAIQKYHNVSSLNNNCNVRSRRLFLMFWAWLTAPTSGSGIFCAW